MKIITIEREDEGEEHIFSTELLSVVYSLVSFLSLSISSSSQLCTAW